jgi:CubicO group peptidase (beta-lactamase class C family)
MKKIISFCFLICITYTLAAQESISKKLDSIIIIYSKCNKFNGSVLACRGGKVLLAKGYGYKSVEDKKNNEYTIFQIGSMTKALRQR